MGSLKRKLRENKTIKCPFAINWAIPKSYIENMTDHEEFLVTPIYDVSNIPSVVYQLRFHPARYLIGDMQAITFYFLVGVGEEKEVYGNYTVEIKSANFSQTYRFNYIKSDTQTFGKFIALRNELLNPENGFFVGDKLILQVSGVLNVFRPDAIIESCGCKKPKLQSLGDLFWFNGEQDFSISVDNKSILAHKSILSVRSEVFRRMFQSRFLETIESRIEITDFDFETVEAAINLCYDREIEHLFNIPLGVELLRFFDKYLMFSLKESMEHRLIPEINVTNVCKLASNAAVFNAFELKKECIKFLEMCLKDGIMVCDIDDLDSSFNEFGFFSFCYQS